MGNMYLYDNEGNDVSEIVYDSRGSELSSFEDDHEVDSPEYCRLCKMELDLNVLCHRLDPLDHDMEACQCADCRDNPIMAGEIVVIIGTYPDATNTATQRAAASGSCYNHVDPELFTRAGSCIPLETDLRSNANYICEGLCVVEYRFDMEHEWRFKFGDWEVVCPGEEEVEEEEDAPVLARA